MTIVIPVIVVFVISFLLLSIWIYKGERKEHEGKTVNLFLVIFTAFVLALAPTAVIGLFLFALLGSTTIANTVFSLDISTNQLMLLSIFLFIYLFSIDNIIEVLVEHIIGEKNIFHYILLLLIRILAFYMIGLMFGLHQTSNFIIATVVAFIVFFIEVLYGKKERDSHG